MIEYEECSASIAAACSKCLSLRCVRRSAKTNNAMFGEDVVVRTRLMPPRLPRRWLRRPRLELALADAAEYPLTIVRASVGYGKSSVLASFAAHGGWPTIWYSLAEGSDDPLIFLLHLIYACRHVVPQVGARALTLLEHSSGGTQAWSQALDALINDLAEALDDETLLVLDDYDAVDPVDDTRMLVERLIAQQPPLLHVILATRHWPQLNSLPTLQARGELLELDEAELAFTEQEIDALFDAAYEHALDPEAAKLLAEQTGGWAIALHLIWQGLHETAEWPTLQPDQTRPPILVPGLVASAASGLAQVLHAESRDVLFAYLAQNVFAKQPDEIQHFLLRSSILAELDPTACNAILGGTASATWLRALYRRGLFLTRHDNNLYSYHPLFHAFLYQRAQATLPDWIALNERAAAYYRSIGAGEKALYHLLAINDLAGAAAELEGWIQPWLDGGRFVTLLAWLDQLPAEVLTAHPNLLIARGDAARCLERFDLALQAYVTAEQLYAATSDVRGQAQALQGQALVYLDTVRPMPANELLRRAFKLLPRSAAADRAAVLSLIAENRLNAGHADQAERLYRMAARLSGVVEDAPQPRVLLRLGRLREARAILERMLPQDQATIPHRRPEAHREITLLLALIGALQGDHSAALGYAQQGLEAARSFGSGLFESIAWMRLGHALQLGATPDVMTAHRVYLQAMALADSFKVQRTKVEAYIGLALLHGFSGDLAAARAAAREGLTIVERSGDRWSAALLWTALGAVSVVNRAAEAEDWLQRALRQFTISHDTYGQALVHLWLAIWQYRAGAAEAAAAHAELLFSLAARCGYDGLLTTTTLFGPRDRMMLVPILLLGRAHGSWSVQAQEWLARGFPNIAADDVTQTYHPGVTLRVQTLGRLRIWRGNDEVTARDWQRKKAAQLFALLLTNRHRWLLREQICEYLWPEESQSDGESHFKVTLNAVNVALEPARPPRTPPWYVRRQGSAYRFFPLDGVWLDVDEFEARIGAAKAQLAAGADDDHLTAAQAELSAAVELYKGDYLSDWLYEEWAHNERERLATAYLEALTTLVELLIKRDQPDQAIQWCEMILMRDPCWEAAYVLLMQAYARQGNRRQALATYERCVRNLRTQMDIAPLPQTTQVYEEVKTWAAPFAPAQVKR